MAGRMKLWFTWYGANTVDKSLPVLSTLIVVVVLSKRVNVDKYACLSKLFSQVRDILSRSPTLDEGRGLSYTLCLLTKPVLRLRLHATQSQSCFPAASNALALPGGNGIFTATPTERITHYTLQAKALNFFILAIHLFFITNWWNSKGTIIYLYLGIKHFVCITISLE